MNPTMLRMIFAGLFALIGIGLGGAIELAGEDVPGWLIAIIAAAGGFLFGHSQANGWNGKKGR